jgi:hypothetical protein
MERLVGNHDISSEPVQTLVMPSNPSKAVLKNSVAAGDGTGGFSGRSFFVSEALPPDHANTIYRPQN